MYASPGNSVQGGQGREGNYSTLIGNGEWMSGVAFGNMYCVPIDFGCSVLLSLKLTTNTLL